MFISFLKKIRILGFRKNRSIVAVLRFTGVIGQTSNPFRSGLTIDSYLRPIEEAFKMPNLKAVAIQINSPGGSPVQSSLIFKRLRSMSEEKQIPVVAFAEDVAASGGYMLACAAEEIFADESSVIGSIGVISSGFGFVDLLEKIGIERRVYTAGDSKNMLDPFQEEKPEDIKRLKNLQNDVFKVFTEIVKIRRGDKLTLPDNKLFTGEFWTGKKALELGLIDGIGDITTVMQGRYGKDVKFKLVGEKKSWLKQKLSTSVSGRIGNKAWATELLLAIEERALWSRFGL